MLKLFLSRVCRSVGRTDDQQLKINQIRYPSETWLFIIIRNSFHIFLHFIISFSFFFLWNTKLSSGPRFVCRKLIIFIAIVKQLLSFVVFLFFYFSFHPLNFLCALCALSNINDKNANLDRVLKDFWNDYWVNVS